MSRSQRLTYVAASLVVLVGLLHYFSADIETRKAPNVTIKRIPQISSSNRLPAPTDVLGDTIGNFEFLKSLELNKKEEQSKVKEGYGKTLCFHVYSPEERGTDVATYDYADYAESLLGYTSKILLPQRPESKKGLSFEKYKSRFGKNVVFYTPDIHPLENNKTELLPEKNFPSEAKRLGCDFVYMLKAGEKHSVPRYPDAFNSSIVRMGVHAVFTWQFHDPLVPYAAISTDVTKNMPKREVVPHMVRPPLPEHANVKSLRQELKIPEKALVVCRHGGMNSFDVAFAHGSVFKLLHRYPNGTLHFVFLGTKVFSYIRDSSDKHPLIHHLPSNSDMEYKERFFKTCNVMLHARKNGESFGLAVAEFSVRNKPVVTYAGASKEHMRILGSKGYVFTTDQQLETIISNFVQKGVDDRDYNAYRDFAPEIVMNKFKKVFLDPIFSNGTIVVAE